jgi:hypothetical protein
LRSRKNEESKRDVSNSSERYPRQQREENRRGYQRIELRDISGLDRHRLNDLYERSSI